MNVFRSFKASGWAKASAAVVAVGTLLVVQVANADRPQASLSEHESSRELVVAAQQKSADTLATHRDHSATSRSLTADTSAAALAGASFYAVSPYRSFDTRGYTDGRLSPGQGFYIVVATDANGVPKIPNTAVAVTYNLTVSGTAGGGGYLSVIPCGQPWFGNSSINWWTSGLDLANGGVVALGSDPNDGSLGCIDVDLGNVPGTSTDFIIDITGYYAP